MLRPLPRLQLILALIAGISSGCIAGTAAAQTASIANAALGKVVAGTTGVTTFRFAASNGAVTIPSGSGYLVAASATTRFLVTVPCTGNAYCKNSNMKITVGPIGTPTGRAGALTNFTFQNGTASVVSGPTGTNPLVVTIGAIGNNNTVNFYIGADYPIYGDDQTGKATGAATTGVYVTTSQTNGTSPSTTNGSATATVDRSLSISQTTPLEFGKVILPLTGTGTISMPASTGTRTVTGAFAVSSPTPTRGVFAVTGEGGQTFSLSVPSQIVVNNTNPGATDSITISTSTTGQGTQILSNAAGAQGTYSFYMGGSFSISSTTQAGPYSGTFTVTVSYN